MTDLLILAGRREGKLDPLAQLAGVSHKCLAPVAGRPMIEYPLSAAAGCVSHVGQILISIDAPVVLESNELVRRLRRNGRLRIIQSAPSLTGSIERAARQATFPLVVTTADNVLLLSNDITTFCEAAAPTADAAVAFARKEHVLSAHPDGQRRFYCFADGEYSNCNLYWVRSRDALLAAKVFRGGGQFAKHPLRILAAFGLMNLIRFKLRRLSLERTMTQLSRPIGLSLQAIEMINGQIAIDVDNERTMRVAAQLLAERQRALVSAA